MHRRPRYRLFRSATAAFVTGAGHGLGAAIAHGLAEAGAGVALADVDAGRRRGGGAAARRRPRCIAMPLDVRDEAAFDAAFDAAVQRFGGIDVMVNNAALTPSTVALGEPASEPRRTRP